jgi:hypothetical protein
VNRGTNVSGWPEAYVSHHMCGKVDRISLQVRVSHQSCANARIRGSFSSSSLIAPYLIARSACCDLRSVAHPVPSKAAR